PSTAVSQTGVSPGQSFAARQVTQTARASSQTGVGPRQPSVHLDGAGMQRPSTGSQSSPSAQRANSPGPGITGAGQPASASTATNANRSGRCRMGGAPAGEVRGRVT